MKKATTQNVKMPTPSALRALGFAGILVGALFIHSSQAWAGIDNQATVNGTFLGNPVSAQSALVSVPVVTKNLHILVTKIADKTVNVMAGDLITYTYTVTNDGNVTVQNLTLNDVHNAIGAAPAPSAETLTDNPPLGNSNDTTANDGVWTSLAPGDTITFTATYRVQQSDVDNLQ